MDVSRDQEHEKKIEEILDVIYQLAFGNLGARARPGNQGDNVDAIMTGLNMLAEELEARVSAIEQSHQELLQSETRFKTVFDSAMDGIIVAKAADQRIYMINNAFCNMLGYSEQELFKKPISTLHQPEDLPMILHAFTKSIGRKLTGFQDILMRRKDGSTFYTEVTSSTMQLQGEVFLLGIFKDVSARKTMELELSRLYREHNAITDTVADVLYTIDLNGNLLWWNRALEKLTGLKKEQLQHRDATEFFIDEDRPAIISAIQDVITVGHSEIEAHFISTKGILLHEINGTALKDEKGTIVGVAGAARDISERRASEKKLRQAAKVFDSTTEGVIITDNNNRIVDVNDAFTEICGYSRDEVIGYNPSILNSGRQSASFYQQMWESLRTSGYWKGEIWNRRKSGETYPEWLNISAIKDYKGEILNFVAVFSDISSLKDSEEQLQHIAHHDPLTELPNRLLFNETLKHALERGRRHNNIIGVIFLDLDRFKNINDSLGHSVGDKLLQKVAKVLLTCAREEDTVARLGGDEFTIILEEMPSAQDSAIIAQRILDAFKKPFNISGHELYAGTSIGISIFPSDGDDVATLVKNADAAMYKAKELGRSNYQFYSPELTAGAQNRLVLETALRHALENNEFQLYYQPQFSINSEKIVAVEALIRWYRPGVGIVSPAEFIPLAEETGLIIPIGEWVLETACKQAQLWAQQGLGQIRIAINVSPRQLLNNDIVLSVRKALEESQIDPRLLELEVTEASFMEITDDKLQALETLKNLGVTFSVDDFGTGYSSLSYLKRLPIDKLKIDQSFVRDIPKDSDDMAIARAVIALGHNLNLTVIAEGVETQQQLKFLQAEGCDEFQGYLCSKPVPAEELVTVFSHNKNNCKVVSHS
jgi:diguanylate cyclase (GGDEF)-like protein/PAS domain S-box-containing protein